MVTAIRNICAGCGEDREQLLEWLKEPIEFKYIGIKYGGTWQKSMNRVKAETLIRKCSLCGEVFSRKGLV